MQTPASLLLVALLGAQGPSWMGGTAVWPLRVRVPQGGEPAQPGRGGAVGEGFRGRWWLSSVPPHTRGEPAEGEGSPAEGAA